MQGFILLLVAVLGAQSADGHSISSTSGSNVFPVVAVVDLDDDGLDERIRLDRPTRLVTITWGSTRNPIRPDTIGLGGCRSHRNVLVRDLNHDGWLDVLTVRYGTLTVYWGSDASRLSGGLTTVRLDGTGTPGEPEPGLDAPRFIGLDAASVEVVTPSGEADSNALVTPLLWVANLSEEACSIPVRMHIGTAYAETVSAFIQPFDAELVSFPEWNALPLGLHAVRCSTMLPGDTWNPNDALRDSVTVVGRQDAASILILVPTGTVDSGAIITPICSIGNRGTSVESIPVRLTIGPLYADTAHVRLEPGHDTVVTFADWRAEPVGLHALRCSTMLVSDEVPSNDLAIRSIIVRPVIDAAALVILAPTGHTGSGVVFTPICSITNNGTAPDSIPVRLRIGTGYDQSVLKYMVNGTADTVHFPGWVASPIGLHTVRCSTGLAEDQNPTNDTVSTRIEVGVRIDAVANAILVPPDTVDSGVVFMPSCRISNNGTRSATIPVRLRIGGSYDETVTRSLAPGTSGTANFPAWTASPLGTSAVFCSTALTADTFPENDTLHGTVTVITRRDAELTVIIAPTGTVDSGTVITPRVVVTNNSTQTESIPVRLAIGVLYDEVDSIILGPRTTHQLRLVMRRSGSGSLWGAIYDATTQRTLSASIDYDGPAAGSLTVNPTEGSFVLRQLPAGDYSLTVIPDDSLYPKLDTSVTVDAGRLTSVTFRIARGSVPAAAEEPDHAADEPPAVSAEPGETGSASAGTDVDSQHHADVPEPEVEPTPPPEQRAREPEPRQ